MGEEKLAIKDFSVALQKWFVIDNILIIYYNFDSWNKNNESLIDRFCVFIGLGQHPEEKRSSDKRQRNSSTENGASYHLSYKLTNWSPDAANWHQKD